MKKLLCLAAVLLLAGCTRSKEVETPLQTAPPVPVSTSVSTPEATSETRQDTGATPQPAQPNTEPLDLTQLSSTMVYAEVFHMVTAPQDYVGRTITAKGTFAVYDANPDPAINGGVEHYFAVVVADATACCQQGLEFVLGNGAVYPDDYPEPGSEICVQGTFALYDWGGTQYGHLVDAKLIEP